MVHPVNEGERFELDSPLELPKAAGFLWNPRLLVQVTCRGYAVAQFLQPEPAKYAHAPNLEARTFMQPEPPYYAHHPGRFFYLKDEDNGDLFSAPYEPVRAPFDHFRFSVGKEDLRWTLERGGIRLELCLALPADDIVELWSLVIHNHSGRARRLGLYTYFPIGYMSWMNQSARHRQDLGGIVARCVTPYQKVSDYFKNRDFKDCTYLLADHTPASWETRQQAFEGEGGLQHPTGLDEPELARGEALYETPAAVLHYRLRLEPGAGTAHRFLFGPARDDAEIKTIRNRYLVPGGFERAARGYAEYLDQGRGCLRIQTPDAALDHFVNHWLSRQMYYHGDVNRLTTDPQTRNYLQDNMGMSYLQPAVARAAFLHALSQQEPAGAMPDGILLIPGAELKYINQIPHTDHCVWLPICLQAYLDETADHALLNQPVADRNGNRLTVFERVGLAMRWLLKARDERGLSYIAQGDWCDPMNMVGYKGRGVSGWLSLATAYALNLWSRVCAQRQAQQLATEFSDAAAAINRAVNQHLWDGQWFARGITDDGTVFGVRSDPEGSLFLNPQSWAILSGAASEQQRASMIQAVAGQLETPYGVMLLAPSFTAMREDIGRVTQKHPGSAENGSIYNHAAAFYVFSLYTIGERDRAYRLLRQMIPGPDESDYRRRGQLPVFIPNYYRGDYHRHPEVAGRSSQLFNTGTVSWFYRCLIEGLFGLRGDHDGLVIQPQLPSHWKEARAVREFRGAIFKVAMVQDPALTEPHVSVDGQQLAGNRITEIEPGRTYEVRVQLPAWGPPATQRPTPTPGP